MVIGLMAALLVAAGCGEGLREAERREPQEWPMFGGSPSRVGYCSEELSPPFEPKWSHRGDALEGGAAAAMRRVFFADTGGKVWCLRHDSGELDWVFEGDAPFRRQVPLVHDKRVFVVDDRGTLYCLDALGGRRLWQKELGEGEASSAAGEGGRVYLSHGKSLLCFDARSGEMLFRVDPPGASRLTAPALQGGRAFVGTDTGELFCVDAITGLVEWRVSLGTGISCGPVASAAGILVGTEDNHLNLLNALNGQAAWSAHLAQPIQAAPAVRDSSAFVGVGDEESLVPATVWCLDMGNGKARWSYQADLYGSLGVSADPSYVYVHGGLVLEGVSGRRVMSQQMEGNPLMPPVPYDGKLYVCSPGGTMTCLGPVSR